MEHIARTHAVNTCAKPFAICRLIKFKICLQYIYLFIFRKNNTFYFYKKKFHSVFLLILMKFIMSIVKLF